MSLTAVFRDKSQIAIQLVGCFSLSNNGVMGNKSAKSNTTDVLLELVSVALSQDNFAGYSLMLKTIAKAMNSYGCVLWEVAPNFDLTADPPKGHLFVLDQWLEDDRPYALYDMPLDSSAAGWVVLNKESYNIKDGNSDPHVSQNPSYVKKLNIKTAALAPIRFSDNNRMAVLVLIRQTPDIFTPEEMQQIEQLALLVPVLYQSIRVKVIFDLTRQVNKVLQEAEPVMVNGKPVIEAMKKPLKEVCNLVKNTFQCIETSIFLEEPEYESGSFKMMATTWPDQFKKTEYYKEEGSLTGWVLNRNRSVRIFDLGNFENDRKSIQAVYPDITWTDTLDIKGTVRNILGLNSEDDALPPLSFMAAPITLGNKVLGAIRCCTATGGTRYFVDRDLQLLELVADQIGQYWNQLLSEIRLKEENEAWHALVEKIGRLNKLVLSELPKPQPNENLIFAEALKVAKSSIKGADILDIRMLDSETQKLFFAETLGDGWNNGTQGEIRNRKRVTFPIEVRPPQSAGAHVYQTGKVHLIKNMDEDPYFARLKLFPDIKRMLLAPIKVADDVLGVLDILSTQDRNFPRNAEGIAELIGQQIGLYRYLRNTIRELRAAETVLKQQVEERSQMMDDLAHQLRSPIHLARARTQLMLRSENDERRLPNLRAISGLCNKARRVTSSMKLLATLARKEPIEVNPSSLQYDSLIRMLIEAARDNELMLDASRHITISVDRDTFRVPGLNLIKADTDLLEQAISNLLDNAVKYSFDATEIQIYGSLQNGYLHISVLNEGLKISPSQVHQCAVRGWRSGDAKMVTGEGSGIGLWIVQGIMDAHRGKLDIFPTTSDHKTEVTLVLPQKGDRG